MRKILFLVCVLVLGSSPTLADRLETGYRSFDAVAEFDDVAFNLENAVVDRGLVVNYTGYLNAMLERTAEVTKSNSGTYQSPYLNAIYLHFCSAPLTHEAIDADPENIAICPYIMFAYELRNSPGTVTVGYRRPIGGKSEASAKAFEKIESLLSNIAKEALE